VLAEVEQAADPLQRSLVVRLGAEFLGDLAVVGSTSAVSTTKGMKPGPLGGA
jgi:hypothetical protein